MDPRTGELYRMTDLPLPADVTAADLGLVEITGKEEDIQHISEVLKSNWTKQQKKERNAKNKVAKASRKKNR